MDLSFGGFNNIIDASNITFKDARIPANPVTSSISYNHDLNHLNIGDTAVVNKQLKTNRELLQLIMTDF